VAREPTRRQWRRAASYACVQFLCRRAPVQFLEFWGTDL
jgi:hypothetical protein